MSTLEHASDRAEPYRQLVVLGVAVAAAALVVGWLSLRGGGTDAVAATDVPTLVSPGELERLAASVDHPVYWAGPRRGFSYELTVTRSGRMYVRYLPAGVKAGDARADFLVVGTYAKPHSFADLRRAGNRDGSATIERKDGAIVVYASERPTNVYFSRPGAGYQVEVYSPDASTARKLVLGYSITPIP